MQAGSLSWEDPLEEGMATHFKYSFLENPMDRGACLATVHRVAKSQTDLQKNNKVIREMILENMLFILV